MLPTALRLGRRSPCCRAGARRSQESLRVFELPQPPPGWTVLPSALWLGRRSPRLPSWCSAVPGGPPRDRDSLAPRAEHPTPGGSEKTIVFGKLFSFRFPGADRGEREKRKLAKNYRFLGPLWGKVTEFPPPVSPRVHLFGIRAPLISTRSPVVPAGSPVFESESPGFGTGTPLVPPKSPPIQSKTPVFGTRSPLVQTRPPVIRSAPPVSGTRTPRAQTGPLPIGAGSPLFPTGSPVAA